MDILKHELYKIYSRKSLFIALLFFLMIFGFQVFQISGDSTYRQLATYYSSIQGPVTQQKVNNAEQALQEIQTLPPINSPQNWAKGYANQTIVQMADQIKYRTTELDELSKQINNLEQSNSVYSFDYKSKVMQYQMLKETDIPVIGYSDGWAFVIKFIPNFGFAVMGALILLGLSPIFSEEYSTHMDSIILSSKHGKGKVITAKILAASIFITGLVLLLAIIGSAAYFLVLGTHGGGYPLQNISGYGASPYALTISQYLVSVTAVHLAGCLAFGLLVLLISCLSRSALIPLFVGGLVFTTPLALDNLRFTIAWINRLIEFSYTEVMGANNLFIGFKVFNLFGKPVGYLQVALVLMAVASIVSIWLTYYTFKHHQVS